MTNRFVHGKITKSTMQSLLKPYPQEIHENIINILKKFEILYQLPPAISLDNSKDSENDIYIVPCMLYSTPSKAFHDFERKTALGYGNLLFGRKYEFNFVPFGFFPRLI